MLDANDYYLSKYEQDIERSEQLTASFENDIEYSLDNIDKELQNIRNLAQHYFDEYGLDIDWREYVKDLI
ncbi:MAG: hypothetical protein JHC33_07830 [Ignisphaera sp.]|nr:hypothetical protein [Ignisphaera sp.]